MVREKVVFNFDIKKLFSLGPKNVFKLPAGTDMKQNKAKRLCTFWKLGGGISLKATFIFEISRRDCNLN